MESESQSQSLSKFIDGHWFIIKKEQEKSEFLEIWDFVFHLFQNPEKKLVGALEILACLKLPFGCDLIPKNKQLDQDKQLNCEWILAKMNKEKIPVYLNEDLDEAIQRLKNNFHFLTGNDSKKGWKFAIASSFKKWAFFGREITNEETVLLSSEIFDVENMKKKTLLDPFLRHLLTILRFDEEEVTKLFDEFEKSQYSTQHATLSMDDSKKGFIERMTKAGMDQKTAVEFMEMLIESDKNPVFF